MLTLLLLENIGKLIANFRLNIFHIVALFQRKSFKRIDFYLAAVLLLHSLFLGTATSFIGILVLLLYWWTLDRQIQAGYVNYIIFFLFLSELYFGKLTFGSYSFNTFLLSKEKELTLTFSESSFLAVYVAVLLRDSKSIYNTLFYTLIIILSKSLLGYTLLAYIFLCRLMTLRYVVLIFFCALLGIISVMSIDYTENLSFSVRFGSIFVWLNYLLSNWPESLIGLGLNNVDNYLIAQYSFLENEFSRGLLPNGLITLFMSFGSMAIIILILLYRKFESSYRFLFWMLVLFGVGNLYSYVLWIPLLKIKGKS